MTNSKDFMAKVATTLRDAVKIKAVMLEKGLTESRAKCPECEGELHMVLVGRKKHARFYCDGTCKRQMME